MTYVVTEACIKCKYTDCVSVCPVDCFYEGENMLVIHPEQCIDCAVCVPECPIDAIKPDTDPFMEYYVALNRKYAEQWPNISAAIPALEDAEEWKNAPHKLQDHFSSMPGEGTKQRLSSKK